MRFFPAAGLGLCVALGYLAFHWIFDGLFLALVGFPHGVQPAWRNDLWWTDFVNAALIGYIPAALRIGQRNSVRDLDALRPYLRCSDSEFSQVRDELSGRRDGFARALSLVGLPIGLAIAYLDPSASMTSETTLSDPRFAWALIRLPVFVGLVTLLVDADIRATRRFVALSREWVIVDLLDISRLSPIARRGQQSVLIWALYLSLFSLFWLGDTAARSNASLLVMVLGLAMSAYFLPLIAIRRNIRATKHAELERLRAEIRVERDITARHTDAADQTPRLANLVTYYQLIDSTREWPIDATNLVRLALYLILGLGSWLGGAIVERMLDGLIG